jgi:tetratricopeptide (TPR) repeat protein
LLYHSTFIYGFLGDVMGLKRSVEELSQLQRDGYDFAFYTEYGRGEYYRERGNVDRAEASLRRALEHVPESHLRDRSAALIALAETLLVRGEHALARDAAAKGLALNEDPELQLLLGKVRGARALAYAEAALGEPKQAIERLARVHLEIADAPCPAARGLIAEARATLALARDDQEQFQEMVGAAEAAYAETANPVLVGRLARLMPKDSGRPSVSVSGSVQPLGSNLSATLSAAVTATLTANLEQTASTAIARAGGPLERATRTLDLLLKTSSAVRGFLFLVVGGRLRLVAAVPDGVPDRGLRQSAETLVQHERRLEGRTVLERRPTRLPDGWHAIMLRARTGRQSRLIGIVLAGEGALPFDHPSEELTEQAASWLFESGDVSPEA